MITSRLHVTVFVGIGAAVWALVLFIQGTPVTLHIFAPFGTVVGVLVLVGLLFEHFAWRLRWLHPWLVDRPDLRGTWKVDLASDWTDKNRTESPTRILCYAGVTQTFSKLQVHLMTPDSTSVLLADRICRSASGSGYEVVGVFLNKPSIFDRGSTSEIHHGAFVLQTHGTAARPDSMSGEYWTDRKTVGQMHFSGRRSHVFTSYASAGEDARRA